MSAIGERLTIVRKDLGMSQVAFAKALHISRSQLGNLETGKRTLNEQTLHILSTDFNINQSWLLTGDGEMYNRAVADYIDLADSAHGIRPADPSGNDKAELFQLAAMFLHHFKNISYSCEGVEEMLSFFSYPSFCDQLGYILSIYSDAQNDPANALVTLKLFVTLFERTFDLSRESKRLKVCGKERSDAFDSDPLTKYAEDYYSELIQNQFVNSEKVERSVSGLAAAGSPLLAKCDDEMTVAVPPKYLDPDHYFIVQAKGDSMEPQIMDGDYVVIERHADPAPKEIALVRLEDARLNEGYTIKRFSKTADSVELFSINPAYRPMVYPLSALRSAERVVHIIHSDF